MMVGDDSQCLYHHTQVMAAAVVVVGFFLDGMSTTPILHVKEITSECTACMCHTHHEFEVGIAFGGFTVRLEYCTVWPLVPAFEWNKRAVHEQYDKTIAGVVMGGRPRARACDDPLKETSATFQVSN
ncbi:hypothetical protein T265_01678 [Opisthorchis viverrini]|uniref:Uncharacterized protein n=1 Tax=Opisthorchis viverrini TaxID=6198 RepID=A0A075A1Y3_OPIVI|nr:hypothetical protein T265_01678 [Opisthorchis viverrini]KER32247.1 hypothetical protein T265_01678 [Opisthorchis viverrini]